MSTNKKHYLAYLQREDAAVVDVLSEPCMIVLFEYNSEQKQWEQSGVEGSAYILRSKVEPVCQLRILNRSGTGNYSIDLTCIEKIKEQDPYIMLRNTKASGHKILGLQVKDTNQRKSLATALKHVIESIDSIRKLNEKEFGSSSSSSNSSSKAAAGSQLLSLLSKRPPSTSPPPSNHASSSESVNVTQLLMRALGGKDSSNNTGDSCKVVYPLFAPSDIRGTKRVIKPSVTTTAVRASLLSLAEEQSFLRLIAERM